MARFRRQLGKVLGRHEMALIGVLNGRYRLERKLLSPIEGSDIVYFFERQDPEVLGDLPVSVGHLYNACCEGGRWCCYHWCKGRGITITFCYSHNCLQCGSPGLT